MPIIYKPTIALADLVFSSGYLDGICYPSVETHDHGINICFSPERADELFKPFEAWLVKVEEQAVHPESKILLHRTEFLRRSRNISPDGKIEWLPPGVGINHNEILRFVRHRMRNLPTLPTRL